MKVKEESEEVGLELNSQKTKIMASGPITSWEIDGETVETVSDFICLKLNIQKTKIMASGPILHGKQMGKQWKQWQTLFSWAPKSLQMVTTAMKLKDTCSLEEKL